MFVSIVACSSVPQPFFLYLQISWSANSGVGRILAEKPTPVQVSRIQGPIEGKKVFNATPSH